VQGERSGEAARGGRGGILGDAAVHPNTESPVLESWSVQLVAKTLHVSETTVRRLITDGEFPGAFRVRKLVRIPVTDLAEYQHRERERIRRTEGRPAPRERDDPLPFEGSA